MNHVLSVNTVESIETLALCNSRQPILARGQRAVGRCRPGPVNLGELVWAGLVLVAITAALALNRLEPGPSSGGPKHGISSVVRAPELLKSLVEQRQEARSRVDITPLRIRRANPNGTLLTPNTIHRHWQ